MTEVQHDTMIEAILTATDEVFSTMVPIRLAHNRSYIERSTADRADGVVSLVGFAGTWVGTGTVACSATLACRLCSALLMTEASAVDEDVLDAVGEVANMIVGSFKTRMEDHVGPLGMSIPTVIYGRNFTARSLSNSEWIVVEFDCEGECLTVKACLAPNSATNAGRPHAPASAAVVG